MTREELLRLALAETGALSAALDLASQAWDWLYQDAQARLTAELQAVPAPDTGASPWMYVPPGGYSIDITGIPEVQAEEQPPVAPLSEREREQLAKALEDGATLDQAAEFLLRPAALIDAELRKAGGEAEFILAVRLGQAAANARRQRATKGTGTAQPFNAFGAAQAAKEPKRVTPEERAAIDAEVAAGRVTHCPPAHHMGHQPKVLEDLR
ncbi:hypothetical protein [Nitrospirillum amazonense]|uniref:hypothetical protein n=1 Tax=Nitrospirillum amazonense TaxID=28077 RepID=UPI002412D32C|nr:hypothetical protein [Nitrospirillum amazonense]MDG3444515.1 hypothetical protein [Nitrospirillum amazonense]